MAQLLLIYAITLIVGTLISGRAQRSILSTAVLFLVSGFVFVELFGVHSVELEDDSVRHFTELAIFAVLFTDGMRVQLDYLKSDWQLPARALLLGLPLTMLGTAVLAHYVADLTWVQSLLVGAALSPTDPVLAAAIVGREEVPVRLRHLLNVESGLNDGLVAPAVVILIELSGGSNVHVWSAAGDAMLGVAIGALLALVTIAFERQSYTQASKLYEPLTAFGAGLLIFAAATLLHANGFLAAFAAGLVFTTAAPHLKEAFGEFGEIVAELLKLGALFIFGALVSASLLTGLSLEEVLFLLGALLVVRPLAMALSLFRGGLTRKEWAAAAWFGPKGFASAVFGLLIASSGIPDAAHLFHLIALVVSASIIAHSSTDVPIARWFRSEEPDRKDVEPFDATRRPRDAGSPDLDA